MVEGGVGRMKHLRGKRKRLQQFLDQSVRRERREEEEKEEKEEEEEDNNNNNDEEEGEDTKDG